MSWQRAWYLPWIDEPLKHCNRRGQLDVKALCVEVRSGSLPMLHSGPFLFNAFRGLVAVLVKDQLRCAALAIGYETDLGIDNFQEKIPLTLGE
jgi:hypothetical protein